MSLSASTSVTSPLSLGGASQSPVKTGLLSSTPVSGTPTSLSGSNASKIHIPVKRICIVGDQLKANNELTEAANAYGIPVLFSSDANEYVEKNDVHDVAFVLNAFTGSIFDNLNNVEATIFGPTALIELSKEESPSLYVSSRPLFCTSMRGLAVCFNGYRQKEHKQDLKLMLFMIHSMGGRVLADVTLQKPKVTHLVTNSCKGEAYTYASTFEIPIMQDEWIKSAWKKRYQSGFKANEETFETSWKVKPFHGAKIYFLGFPKEEKDHMVDELRRNGGVECVDYNEDPCTHVVIDNNVMSVPSDIKKDVFIVKVEWFWASIQMDACAEEKMYYFSEAMNSFLSPRPANVTPYFSPSTPGSQGKRKKRRTEALRQLAQSDASALQNGVVAPSTSKKARSSLGDLSGSFILDTPDKNKLSTPSKDEVVTSPAATSIQITSPKADGKPLTPRQQVFSELVQTEENYVKILRTIMEVFKEPLEDPKMQFLNPTEMKIIFGNIPPILNVHSKMLTDLTTLMKEWREPCCVGKVLLRYTDDLLRAYPPFVNYFENMKHTLEDVDAKNPRFHAFLKVCQSRRECGRQTLSELLIRPVQRLGSISLLLNDLLKHTKKERDHPDVAALEEALSKIKEVLTNINEDKRKTEGQVHIFEIFSDIENCPPHLVSSHRKFLSKLDVVELGGSDELSSKGSDLTLFLFTDVLEVSKRRRSHGGRVSLVAKSPSTMSLRNSGLTNAGGPIQHSTRLHKHVDLMQLSSVRRVVDLIDGEDCKDCFALVCRTNQDFKERMYVFQIASDEVNKGDFLRMLCRNVANTMYRQDPENYLVQLRPDELGLTSSDLSVNKTYRSLHRVKKAFSFNKTPTSRLTRAMSTMISPLTNSTGGPHHHAHNTQHHNGSNQPPRRDRLPSTPNGGLQNLRLQSCSDLLDQRSSNNPVPTTLSMTPGRKFPMAPPPPSPGGISITSSAESDSPKSEKSKGFTIPKTPTICVRRASFKFLSNSLGKKY